MVVVLHEEHSARWFPVFGTRGEAASRCLLDLLALQRRLKPGLELDKRVCTGFELVLSEERIAVG